MRKLAIFDLDGTLLNTLDDLANACNHALCKCGFPQHPVDAYKKFVGNGVHNLIKRALAPVDDAGSIEKVESAYRSYYKIHSEDCTCPYDGIPALLEFLQKRGVRVAVATNKPHENAIPLVKQYFPGLVDRVEGQREGLAIKPDPEVVLQLMDRFQVAREECVYIGDSDVDMQTGKNAGVLTVGVTWGFRTREELEANGSDVIIDKSDELQKLFIDN